MASIINASSTGSGGIVQTADASGVLQLQSNGTAAVTVATTANIGIGTASPTVRLQIEGTTDATQRIVVNGSGNYSSLKLQYNGTEIAQFQNYQNTEVSIGATASTATLYLVTNNTNRLAINPSGYVTMPYQPMFSVFKANGSVTGNSSGVQVIYNSVQVNVSSSYSTSNGYFTAPIAGTYYFSAMGMAGSVSGNYDIQLQIQVNGSSVSISNPPVANSNFQGMGFACSCMTTLAAGDSVRVVYYSSTASVFYAGGGPFNNFSGFLVG
jgi:hypothetical protein